jgi:ABC-2 type transport system permease protein
MSTGLGPFLAKELTEALRTWRLPVLGGVVLFFALSGPVLALLTPQLLQSMQASQPGVVIQLPDPTWRDAYGQWIKNLSQIVAFVAIIAAAGTVSGEVASGTAALVLTKPVSRSAFVVAKAISLFALVAACVALGTLLTQAVTLVVFGQAPVAPLWGPMLAWLAFAGLLVAIATLLSALLPTLAAAGLAVGAFFAISLAALWGPAVRYSPAGLTLAPGELLLGKDPALLWPLATTLAAAVALVTVAAALFARREL